MFMIKTVIFSCQADKWKFILWYRKSK